jgi:hypothetical protein
MQLSKIRHCIIEKSKLDVYYVEVYKQANVFAKIFADGFSISKRKKGSADCAVNGTKM